MTLDPPAAAAAATDELIDVQASSPPRLSIWSSSIHGSIASQRPPFRTAHDLTGPAMGPSFPQSSVSGVTKEARVEGRSCLRVQQAMRCKTASPEIFHDERTRQRVWQGSLNKPKAACRNKLLLFWLPDVLGHWLIHCTAFYFRVPFYGTHPQRKKIRGRRWR